MNWSFSLQHLDFFNSFPQSAFESTYRLNSTPISKSKQDIRTAQSTVNLHNWVWSMLPVHTPTEPQELSQLSIDFFDVL